jgi:hypothetical protein
MTALAAEVLRILESERGFQPLAPGSLVKILHAIGYGDGRLEESIVQVALEEGMAAGQVERIYSARMGPRYRAMQRPAAVVAEAGNRT